MSYISLVTKLAESYYQGRAEQFAITDIPAILNGQPVPFSTEGAPLSIHNLSRKTDTPLSDTLHETLTSTHDFLAAQLLPDLRELVTFEDVPSNRKNSEFARRALFSLLVPKKVATGKIKDAHIEAIAREEVDEETLQKIRATKAETSQIDDYCEAYFRVKGNVVQGSNEVTRQGLVLVGLMHLQRLRRAEIVKTAVVPIHHGLAIGKSVPLE